MELQRQIHLVFISLVNYLYRFIQYRIMQPFLPLVNIAMNSVLRNEYYEQMHFLHRVNFYLKLPNENKLENM